MHGAVGAGRSVRTRQLAMGMLLACTSLVANAVMNGEGSLAPRTVAALPEPFPVQGAATGPHPVGVSVVTTATALASSSHLFTGSGPVVPGSATGQDDGSPGPPAEGAVAPSGVDLVEPVENPVAGLPDTSPAFEPVPPILGKPERSMAPVLQPVTELLASAVQPMAPPVVTDATGPALLMLSPQLFG